MKYVNIYDLNILNGLPYRASAVAATVSLSIAGSVCSWPLEVKSL